MQKLDKQILLKVSDELNIKIDKAFTILLKKEGKYITRSEFIRQLIEKGCMALLEKK